MIFDQNTLKGVTYFGKRAVLTDESRPGFAIKVYSREGKQFYYRFKQQGERREVALGKDFRVALQQYLTLQATVIPQPHKAYDAPDDCLFEPGITLELLCSEFMAKYVLPKLSGHSAKNYQRFLNELLEYTQFSAKPLFFGRCTGKEARKYLKTFLNKVAEQVPISSARMQSCYSSMFKWGLAWDKVTENPIHDMPVATARPRSRLLSRNELSLFFPTIRAGLYDQTTVAALYLILLTGMRPGEVRSLTPSMVDLEQRRVILPKTKNGRPHLVPLVLDAAVLLERNIKPGHKPNERLFKVSEYGLRQVCNRVCKRADVTVVAPHDLRRTAATHAASLGVPTYVIAALLNHTVRSVTTQHYVMYDMEKERREALEILEADYQKLGLSF